MAEITEGLYKLGKISGTSIFIDRTKIESVANKYIFDQRKSVTKSMVKLFDEISELVNEGETFYFLH